MAPYGGRHPRDHPREPARVAFLVAMPFAQAVGPRKQGAPRSAAEEAARETGSRSADGASLLFPSRRRRTRPRASTRPDFAQESESLVVDRVTPTRYERLSRGQFGGARSAPTRLCGHLSPPKPRVRRAA